MHSRREIKKSQQIFDDVFFVNVELKKSIQTHLICVNMSEWRFKSSIMTQQPSESRFHRVFEVNVI